MIISVSKAIQPAFEFEQITLLPLVVMVNKYVGDGLMVTLMSLLMMKLTINYQRQSAQDSGVGWLQEMANELKFIFLVNSSFYSLLVCFHHFHCFISKLEEKSKHFETLLPMLWMNNRLLSATGTQRRSSEEDLTQALVPVRL